MSADTNPIDPARFALALESLPLDSLHAKAAEIRNSIGHLKSSNEQMLPFADQGDQDCKEAMFENLTVIGRMNERIALLRAEVEKRGFRWSEGEVEDAEAAKQNGVLTGAEERAVNGTNPAVNGRLTDEELRRRLEEQMADDEEEGVHL